MRLAHWPARSPSRVPDRDKSRPADHRPSAASETRTPQLDRPDADDFPGTVRHMVTLAPIAAALLALLAGAWLAAAIWASLRATRREAAAGEVAEANVRLAALLEAGPAMPLIVAADGAISGPDRLAGALGLDALPPRWLALFGDEAPFPTEKAAELGRVVSEA